MTWHTRTPNYSDQPRRIIWIVYKRASEPQPSRYPSVPQDDDGQGWGEAKKQWADCKCSRRAALPPFASSSFRSLGLSLGWHCIACTDAHGLAVGDPKRKLCGLDMDPTVSLDYRKRDGRWVPLESVSKL
jgi:hypothetical protein